MFTVWAPCSPLPLENLADLGTGQDAEVTHSLSATTMRGWSARKAPEGTSRSVLSVTRNSHAYGDHPGHRTAPALAAIATRRVEYPAVGDGDERSGSSDDRASERQRSTEPKGGAIGIT